MRTHRSMATHGVGARALSRLAVGLVLLVAPAVARAAGAFIPLGHLPGGFGEQGWASAVSADGTVVVGLSDQACPEGTCFEAYRWTADTGMVGLGWLPGSGDGGFYSDATGVSDDGSIVVGESHSTPASSQPFRWTAATGMVDLGTLPGGIDFGAARAVSPDGSVIVGSASNASGSQEAFRWTAGTGMQGLGYLSGAPANGRSNASDASIGGSVIVGWSSNADGRSEAYRWTADSGMVGLGQLPGADRGFASGVSDDGSVVVGSSGKPVAQFRSEYEAFRWTADAGMVGLGVPPGWTGSGAGGVSGDGSIVVGAASRPLGPGTESRAIIWDAVHGMRLLQDVLETDYGLDLTGWTLWEATGISTDGRAIVGMAINPNGGSEGWLATLSTQCSDGVDNDGDGLADFPADPGCASAADDSEQSAALTCDNGLDDDGDGLIDLEDPGCPFPVATPENPPCDDGIDNDGDGAIDFDDPQCSSGWPYWEEWPSFHSTACGVGFELAAVLPLAIWLHGRRRRRQS